MRILKNNFEANLVEVDFYRPDIDEYPIVSPKYFNSQNYVLLVFYEEGFKILAAQVRFFEKSEEQVGIYPLITGREAYEKLKTGRAYIVTFPKDTKDIIIKKMFLGYLDPDVYQTYLQPVYIFLGDDNFVSYVAAIRDDYLIE